MRLCERASRLWLVASVASIALLYGLFAISSDLSLDTWRMGRFGLAYGADEAELASLNATTKKILFWNTMFGDETFYFGHGDIFKHCPGVSSQCWATHDRSLLDVEDFDALLIHGSDLENLADRPPRRRDAQRYVFVNLESPENRPILFKEFDYDYFNVTMTYRLDSDVVWSYADIREVRDDGLVAPRADAAWSTMLRSEATGPRGAGKSHEGSGVPNNRRNGTETSHAANKSKTAAWFVSNCRAKSKRENYVEELGRHVDVDVFGRCGKSGCTKDRDCFRDVVAPHYYFYLSFENSMCQDYVTEKFYNVLKYNVVPVVYGGANYNRFAPPKSYINALDFNSPKELAKFLKKLIREPQEYDKYFEWKRHYKVVSANRRVICELCQYLHNNSTFKSYSPLSDWYERQKCPLQQALRDLPYMTKKYLKSL